MISTQLHELEQSVIGAVLLSPDNLALLPDLASTHFASPWARHAWNAIRNLETAGRPIDLTTISDELSRVRSLRNEHRDEPELHAETAASDAGIFGYLGECALKMPTVDNAVEYARRVKDHALRRRLLETLGEIVTEGSDAAITGAELLTRALAGLSVLDAESPENVSTIGDVLKRRVAQLEEIARQRALGLTSLTGFHTGVEKLDEKLGGWQPGIVSIVAARPGMGKSSLGLATADACSAHGFGVHLFSLEDTEAAYADRVLSRHSSVPAEALRNCSLSRGQMSNVSLSLHELKKREGWLVDGRSGTTAQEIVRSVRRHKRTNATRVVIVDYVQLVAKPTHMMRATTHEVLTDTITAFADAAKQDNVAYVVMSQLNREIEKRSDKRPQLSDLRESGSLEERAKCVVGLYRGVTYGGKPVRGIDYPHDGQELSRDEFERAAQLIVLKNSNGRTGVVHATWNGPTTRIE